MELSFGDVTVALTNLGRVVFPDSGRGDAIAKREVIDYYRDVADVMLPELEGRPLSIERFTKSVDQGGFFQKHWQKHFPAWLDSAELGVKTRVRYPIVNTTAGLVYLANQGGVAFHIWTSRADTADHPDLIVFDLDPPEGGFAMVRQVALLLRDTLDEIGLTAFAKTTGGKGMHVVAPLDGAATFDEVHALCGAMATRFVARYPELVTTEFYKKDRQGRLFFDTLRNAPGATFVAPYSLRGTPGAPVSAPVTWAEVEDDTLAPDGFTLRDIASRLDTINDPWGHLRARPGSVAAARRALAALA